MSKTEHPTDEPSIVGGSAKNLDPMIEDAIHPTAIHHRVDELRAEGELLQYYNYLVYEFERDGQSCIARTYVEMIDEVALLGPVPSPNNDRKVPESAFRDDVLQYLKRRFHHITELGDEGYITVWTRSD